MSEEGDSTDITSTLEFEPPCMVRWSRFDKEGNTRFITAFYAIPAGMRPRSCHQILIALSMVRGRSRKVQAAGSRTDACPC